MSLPNYPALVLNADYQPINIHPLSTWGFERVLRAVLKGRVTVVDEYDATLRSPSFTYRPPSVVALNRYVKVKEAVSFNRINIFLRDDFRCGYCDRKFNPKDLTFDHVVPRSKGGPTNFENITSACMDCNSRKGDRYLKPIREPRIPTQRELARKLPPAKVALHNSWLDILYWSGVLLEDE